MRGEQNRIKPFQSVEMVQLFDLNGSIRLKFLKTEIYFDWFGFDKKISIETEPTELQYTYLNIFDFILFKTKHNIIFINSMKSNILNLDSSIYIFVNGYLEFI